MPTTTPTRAHRILVADDDAAFRASLGAGLRVRGFEVTTAASVEELFDAASRRGGFAEHDAVVSDLRLSDRDALSVLRSLRKQRPSMPFVVMTAVARERTRESASRAGADLFLVKPFGVEYLADALAVLLRPSPAAAKRSITPTGVPAAITPSPSRGVILVAEDDDDTRAVLARALTEAGHEVVELHDGAELMAYVTSAHLGRHPLPGLIVADVRMPGASGLDVVLELRRRGVTTDAILISAYIDRVNRELARASRTTLLPKPIDPDMLLAAIDLLQGK